MLVTLENNCRNRNHAFALAGAMALTVRGCGLVFGLLCFFLWASVHSSTGWFGGDASGG